MLLQQTLKLFPVVLVNWTLQGKPAEGQRRNTYQSTFCLHCHALSGGSFVPERSLESGTEVVQVVPLNYGKALQVSS